MPWTKYGRGKLWLVGCLRCGPRLAVTYWCYATFVRRLVEASTPWRGEWAVLQLCIEYPGICLTIEENDRVLYEPCLCICSLRYPACNAHASYFNLRPAPLYNIFPHYLINFTIFEKKNTEHKICVLIFSITFVWKISHSRKNSVWYCRKCTMVFMESTRYSCQILMKLEFSRQIFEKSSNIKFHKNPSSGSRVVPCGRTDRHDVANSRFSLFCDSV